MLEGKEAAYGPETLCPEENQSDVRQKMVNMSKLLQFGQNYDEEMDADITDVERPEEEEKAEAI
jgi:hypothetical protein